MANPNKDDLNQNQHTNKARAASAGASTRQPEPEGIEGVDSPETIGGERPNPSNTGSMKNETGERLNLKGNEEQPERHDR
jgi:hypothetical protein